MSSHGSSNTGAKQTGGMASATKTPANAGVGDPQPNALDAQGMIGKQFTGKAPPFLPSRRHRSGKTILTARILTTAAENGALGGAAQKIGGPLDKEGVVGKQFTTEGALGGTVQNAMGGTKGKSN